jgi:hypothetical protein
MTSFLSNLSRLQTSIAACLLMLTTHQVTVGAARAQGTADSLNASFACQVPESELRKRGDPSDAVAVLAGTLARL